MCTFAQKQKTNQKANQQTTSAKFFAKPSHAHSGQNREVNSILHLQRTIGNQAVQQLQRSNTEDLKMSPASNASTAFAHNFSRIPVHASARNNKQPKLKVNAPGDIHGQEAERAADQVMRMPESQLSRVYACGGGCSKCQQGQSGQEHLHIRRMQASNFVGAEAPRIVHNVLRSPGRLLAPKLRSFFEPRFDHDFSQVRLHTDSTATESAKAINAFAYSVGRDIVIAKDKYAPHAGFGQKLLAHELAHIVQQQYASKEIIQRQESTDATQTQTQPGTVSSLLPGYSQEGDTCGATSLVSALMIWDRQNQQPDQPNEMVVAAIDITLTWLVQHRRQTIEGWNDKGFDGEALYQELTHTLTAIRDHARQPQSRISEREYQAIGIALYALWVDGSAGLSAADISNLQRMLGLETGQSDVVQNFEEIFTSPTLRGLNPGEIAQVGWFVQTAPSREPDRVSVAHHAFLIGRFQDGQWFLSDQGPRPPAEFVAPDLMTLRSSVVQASQEGHYWLFTGQFAGMPPLGWTGVKLLGGPSGVRSAVEELVPRGTYLAEIDIGAWPLQIGDRITSSSFISRHDNFRAAQIAATHGTTGPPNYGALIVEMPRGTFSAYETNLVSNRNIYVSEIDRPEGGLLTRRTFYHTWLILSDGSMARQLQVY